jgi:hypothetical protein
MLPLLTSILSALLYIAILVLVCALIVWVLEMLVGPIPPYILKIGKIILALVCVIVLLGVFTGGLPPLWHSGAYPLR